MKRQFFAAMAFLVLSVSFVSAQNVRLYFVDMDMLLEQFPDVKVADENLAMYRKEQEDLLIKEVDEIRKPLNVEPLKSKSDKYVDLFKTAANLMAKKNSGLISAQEEKQLENLAKEMEKLEADLGPTAQKVNEAMARFNEKVDTRRIELVMQNRAKIKNAIEEYVQKDLRQKGVVIESIDSRHIYVDPAINITQKILEKLK